jgi:hypothetical protein
VSETPEEAPRWSGTYAVPVEVYEAPGGHDDVVMACARQVRESAREYGHAPVGAVDTKVLREDPFAAEEDREPETGKVWIATSVQVRPGGHRIVMDAQSEAARLFALNQAAATRI